MLSMNMTPPAGYSSLSSVRSTGAFALKEKSPRTLANRACSECRRKKSKCDMKRPDCSLCWRIGAVCAYPTRRAPSRKKNAISNSTVTPSNSQQQSVPPPPVVDGSWIDDHTALEVPLLSKDWGDALPSPNDESFQTLYDHFLSPDIDIDLLGTNLDILDEGGAGGAAQRSDTWATGVGITDEPEDGPELSTVSCTAIRIGVSPATAKDLVKQFFSHVHFYVPLLHRDKFNRAHHHILCSTAETLCDLPWETAFLLCSIFALSARFSTSEELADEQPIRRGDRFACQAAQLLEHSSNQLDHSRPSMSFLQAMILLTFFTAQSGPSRQAWLRSGTCIRLAYELELHVSDADIISGEVDLHSLSCEEYSLREERRRAWWVIWDIDTFLSFMALRPSTAGHHKMQVLLPVPDEIWLTGKIVSSTYLEPENAMPWRRLSDSPTQSAWAWFLASTTLARQVTDIMLSPSPSEEVLEEVEAKLTCYTLALPESFRIDLNVVRLNSEQAQGMQWIISSLLLSQRYDTTEQVRDEDTLMLIYRGQSTSTYCGATK